jgi:hypothetical protein
LHYWIEALLGGGGAEWQRRMEALHDDLYGGAAALWGLGTGWVEAVLH